MSVVFGAAPRAPHGVELGRGVRLTLRPLSALEHGRLFGLAAREIDALIEGRETERAWGDAVTPDDCAAFGEDRDARAAGFAWLRTVLVAEAAAVALDGVTDAAGAPLAPTFDVLAWLLKDALFEGAVRTAAFATEALWDAEKNVLGRVRPGPSATAPNTAPAAAPSTSLAPPEASPPTGNAAPSLNTPPAPTTDASPGASSSGAAVGGALE